MLLSLESRCKPERMPGGIKFVLGPCLKVHALCGFHLRVGIRKARFPAAWYSGRIKTARLPGDVFASTGQGHPSISIAPDTERTAHAIHLPDPARCRSRPQGPYPHSGGQESSGGFGYGLRRSMRARLGSALLHAGAGHAADHGGYSRRPDPGTGARLRSPGALPRGRRDRPAGL
jgi:hypothetical protein